MLHWAAIAIGFLGCATSLLAQGSGSTGGGKAVVCRASANTIVKATILDLYEASIDPTIELREPAQSFADEANLYQTIFDDLMQAILPIELVGDSSAEQYIQDMFHFVETPLADFDDAGPTPELKSGCFLEQLAIYDDVISVDREIWDSLDAQNQVALYAHEILYFKDRQNGAITSERSRRAVGLLFSTTPWKAIPILRQINSLK